MSKKMNDRKFVRRNKLHNCDGQIGQLVELLYITKSEAERVLIKHGSCLGDTAATATVVTQTQLRRVEKTT